MAGDASHAEDNARVLNTSVGISQMASDNAHVTPNRQTDHLSQPIGGSRLDIVIEQRDDAS